MGIFVIDVFDVEKMLGRCVSGKNLEMVFLVIEGNFLNYEKNILVEILERFGEKEMLIDSSWKFERESLDFII